jgi:hypothetical protein
MIWDMPLIWNVRRMYCTVAYGLEHADQKEYIQLELNRLRDNLIAFGKDKFGVTLHAADLHYETTEVDRYSNTIKVEASWHPSTHAVEFCGGPRDGELMVVQEKLLFQDIFLPVPPQIPTFALSGDLTALVPIQHLSYRHTGWHQEQRRWIYTYQRQK